MVVRFPVVWWTHAQVTMAGGLEGFGDEGGYIPLYLAGGRFGVIPASIVDSSGIRVSLDFVGDAWL